MVMARKRVIQASLWGSKASSTDIILDSGWQVAWGVGCQPRAKSKIYMAERRAPAEGKGHNRRRGYLSLAKLKERLEER